MNHIPIDKMFNPRAIAFLRSIRFLRYHFAPGMVGCGGGQGEDEWCTASTMVDNDIARAMMYSTISNSPEQAALIGYAHKDAQAESVPKQETSYHDLMIRFVPGFALLLNLLNHPDDNYPWKLQKLHWIEQL
jgi:hypothetical protein